MPDQPDYSTPPTNEPSGMPDWLQSQLDQPAEPLPHAQLNAREPRVVPRQPPPMPPQNPPPSQVSRNFGAPPRRFWEGFRRALLLIGIFGGIFLIFGAFVYFFVAKDLPSPDELQNRSAQFVSTRIFDRNGKALNEVFDSNAGRRSLVKLDKISPNLINATIATEDANFYRHPGVDPIGIARAVWRAIRDREAVVGGSTIPQQLVKLVFLSPERTFTRKMKEAILAAEITRTYQRDRILEIYLNEINYGNLTYGIESAAQGYFGKSAADLTLPEAALLAGLPQAPAFYDPYTNPEGAKERQGIVLRLMVKSGYITPVEADTAWLAWDAQHIPLVPPKFAFEAPHFVVFVREQLERTYGTEILYKGGLQVYTTLDSDLQKLAEDTARERIARFSPQQHVTNAALVALRPQSGEILAMLGSVDFNAAEISGQVNVATSPRQPGSAIKPLTYLAAFASDREWWTPATTLMDIRTEFPDGAGRPPYVPKNYDDKEHGLVNVRTALANSYNIPAVKALEHVGIFGLLETANRFGIESLNRQDYGLSLTLGGGEVTLLELTGAYAALANQGEFLPPVAIQCVLSSDGQLLGRGVAEFAAPACQDAARKPQNQSLQAPADGKRVVDASYAYLISSILSDNDARTPSFGPNSALRLPGDRPAAVKTGTTNDFRDNWTIGYTPDLTVGVWVGNSDGSPMRGVSGVAGAGPIWNKFVATVLRNQPARPFPMPADVELIEVCADSGTVPSEACPARRSEVFVKGRGPLGAEFDIHRKVRIFKVGDQEFLAPPECPDQFVELRNYVVYPPEGRQWAIDNGISQPPTEIASTCQPPNLLIAQPADGENVSGLVRVVGTVQMADFDRYVVEYGEGDNPIGWGAVAGPIFTQIDNNELAVWDTTSLRPGQYTLRMRAFDRAGHEADARVRVFVQQSTPIPTISPTVLPIVSPDVTSTPTPIFSPTPTSTPEVLPTFTVTPEITATETPIEPTPTIEPTQLPTPEPLNLQVSQPVDNSVVSGVVQIVGTAAGDDFSSYRVEIGLAPEPSTWISLTSDVFAPVSNDILAQLDTTTIPNGDYILRLVGTSSSGPVSEVRVRFSVSNEP